MLSITRWCFSTYHHDLRSIGHAHKRRYRVTLLRKYIHLPKSPDLFLFFCFFLSSMYGNQSWCDTRSVLTPSDSMILKLGLYTLPHWIIYPKQTYRLRTWDEIPPTFRPSISESPLHTRPPTLPNQRTIQPNHLSVPSHTASGALCQTMCLLPSSSPHLHIQGTHC